MVTFEVKVKDGRVYKLRDSVSTKDALEYIKTYMLSDVAQAAIADIKEDETDIRALATAAMQATCNNLNDADWLLRHVLVDENVDMVPLHHTYQLLKPMRRAIHWEDLIDTVNSMQTDVDPDFPEDESKNSLSASG